MMRGAAGDHVRRYPMVTGVMTGASEWTGVLA
jgi:hypothetical protein